MDTAQQLPITEQEYLAGEHQSPVKHEFIDGQVYAMVGTSDDHNRIAGNLFSELRQRLKGTPCDPFFADVSLKAGKDYFYPDVMVICDNNEQDTSHLKHAPTVVVEVLSPFTRKIDVTRKKVAYLNLPSLQEYLLIEQDKCEIEVFRRSESWASTYYVLDDVIHLASIDVSITVEEIYDRVQNDDIEEYNQAKE